MTTQPAAPVTLDEQPMAKFTFKLKAKSGYSAEGSYSISPDQYADVIRVCEGTLKSVALDCTEPKCDSPSICQKEGKCLMKQY